MTYYDTIQEHSIGEVSTCETTRLRAVVGVFQFIEELSPDEYRKDMFRRTGIDNPIIIDKIISHLRSNRRKRAFHIFLENVN